MKRIHTFRLCTAIVLALALLVTMVACAEDDTSETASATEAVTNAPATESTTEPTSEATTDPASEGETDPVQATYLFTVVYGDTQLPAEGVQVQLCQGDDFCLMPAGTDAEGKVSYSLGTNPYGVYDVHILEDSLPEGYTFDNAEIKTSAEETSYTLTLKPVEAETDPATDAQTETSLESDADTEPESETEEPDPATVMDMSAEVINIGTAKQLMYFNQYINCELDESVYSADWYGLDGQTVCLTADIDLAGYEWTPLDGEYLWDVIFDGQGHSIKNMTIYYNLDRVLVTNDEGANSGCGFIGTAAQSTYLEFRNITFEGAYIVARERHIGCLIGRNMGATCSFEDVTLKDLHIDGWCDYNNQTADNDGYHIAFRVGGFVGATFAGSMDFTRCTVKGMYASGFHNLAAFLGCDNVTNGSVSGYSFQECHAEDVHLVFSYWLINDPAMAKRYVTVFFNEAGNQWFDTLDECLENGNTYLNVYYYDWTSTDEVDDEGNKNIDLMDSYLPENFRSWTPEDAAS